MGRRDRLIAGDLRARGNNRRRRRLCPVGSPRVWPSARGSASAASPAQRRALHPRGAAATRRSVGGSRSSLPPRCRCSLEPGQRAPRACRGGVASLSTAPAGAARVTAAALTSFRALARLEKKKKGAGVGLRRATAPHVCGVLIELLRPATGGSAGSVPVSWPPRRARARRRHGRGHARRQVLHVLRGVDLTLEPGEMVAIVGASRCGQVDAVALPRHARPADAGQHLLRRHRHHAALAARAGQRFRNQRRSRLRFQFHHLLAEFTALENAMMPALIEAAWRVQEARERAGICSRHVGLSHRRLTHRPGEPVGRRAAARRHRPRALVMQPALLAGRRADRQPRHPHQRRGA